MHTERVAIVAGSSHVMRPSAQAAPRSGSSATVTLDPTPHSPAPLAHVDGWPITLAGLDQAVAAIIAAAARGESFSAVTLNLDHLVKLRRSDAFRRAYASARFVTADGAPVARLARFTCKDIARTTGADLVAPLADAAAVRGIPIYLFGSSPEVLGKAARDLAVRTDGALDIAGTEAPPHGFDPESREADDALDRIAASGARLCFLALGAPKQEILAARAVSRGIKVGFVSVGAALDFIAGAQVRAPEPLRTSGMEWLWRLATNPRRLAMRYAQCALLLADLTLVARVRQRLGFGGS